VFAVIVAHLSATTCRVPVPSHPRARSSKRNQKEAQNILKLEGVNDTSAARWYAGKRVCYIYKAKTEKNGTKLRAIWGRVSRPHGTTGAVRAKFTKNLPPKALGAPVRVMLYPSTV
jgi:large subunit ribosomal protein L35Ae